MSDAYIKDGKIVKTSGLQKPQYANEVAYKGSNVSLELDKLNDSIVDLGDKWIPNPPNPYQPGDLRIHNNRLWECTVATSTEEPSESASCWKLTSLNETLAKKYTSINDSGILFNMSNSPKIELPLHDVGTVYRAWYRKVGFMVEVQLYVDMPNPLNDGNIHDIGALPQGFRPICRTQTIAGANGSWGSTNNDDMIIAENGTISYIGRGKSYLEAYWVYVAMQ